MRILVLDESGYPEKFYNHTLKEYDKEKKKTQIENRILKRLKDYNNKLEIEKIVYMDIKDIYGTIYSSKYSGLIVDCYEPASIISNINKYKQIEIDNKEMLIQIFGYVFLSTNTETSRNILFTQSIFPGIIDIAEKYLNSPMYSIVNHPIYFLNMIQKDITASTLKRRIILMKIGGIEFINLFPSNLDDLLIPNNCETFIEEYETENILGNKFETDYYSINFKEKKFKIKTTKLIESFSYDKRLKYNKFHGSEEKFYWMEVTSLAIFAFNLEYKIDISETENFICEYKNKFGKKSKKIDRCIVLFEYFKKLSLKEDYYYV